MKKRILVFPCGSEVGLEIYRSLAYSTHFEVVGGSSVHDHGEYVYQEYISGIPFVDSPDFIDSINRIIHDNNIDLIFPAHDSVVVALANAFENKSLDCPVVGSSAETCRLLRSKKATYEFFHGKIKTPRVYEKNAIEQTDYPIFLKPDVGQGSRGTAKVDSHDELEYHTKRNKDLLMLEYLPGKEYTIDCLTDINGKLAYICGRERARISNGISVSSQAVDDQRFKELAEIINTHIKFTGVWFFQVKENYQGELVLMEISPRVAGTMGFSRCLGANLALLTVFIILNYEVSVIPNSYNLAIDRALENRYRLDITYDKVYLDFDDLVVFNGKVNPAVMKFVFQCHNEGRTIHLITRHAKDIHETLKSYRLQSMFDEIIHIKREDEKFKYINTTNAIFIDDSHRERSIVARECHIPTFDAHMLEALLL